MLIYRRKKEILLNETSLLNRAIKSKNIQKYKFLILSNKSVSRNDLENWKSHNDEGKLKKEKHSSRGTYFSALSNKT